MNLTDFTNCMCIGPDAGALLTDQTGCIAIGDGIQVHESNMLRIRVSSTHLIEKQFTAEESAVFRELLYEGTVRPIREGDLLEG